jgi:hypothetical protein
MVLMYQYRDVVEISEMLPTVFAGFTGALLSAMGVKLKDGIRAITLIVVCAALAGILGRGIGLMLF